jgi:hypothetical protein
MVNIIHIGQTEKIGKANPVFIKRAAEKLHLSSLVRFSLSTCLVSFRHGTIGEPVCNCEAQEPGMSMATKHRIVQETGDHYKVLEQQVVKDNVRHSTKKQLPPPPAAAKVYGESWNDAMVRQIVGSLPVEVE